MGDYGVLRRQISEQINVTQSGPFSLWVKFWIGRTGPDRDPQHPKLRRQRRWGGRSATHGSPSLVGPILIKIFTNATRAQHTSSSRDSGGARYATHFSRNGAVSLRWLQVPAVSPSVFGMRPVGPRDRYPPLCSPLNIALSRHLFSATWHLNGPILAISSLFYCETTAATTSPEPLFRNGHNHNIHSTLAANVQDLINIRSEWIKENYGIGFLDNLSVEWLES